MVRLPFSPVSLNDLRARIKTSGLLDGFEEELDEADESLFHASRTDHEATLKYLSTNHDAYGDRTTIDWLREYAKERLRVLRFKRLRGLHSLGSKLWHIAAPWIVVTVSDTSTVTYSHDTGKFLWSSYPYILIDHWHTYGHPGCLPSYRYALVEVRWYCHRCTG